MFHSKWASLGAIGMLSFFMTNGFQNCSHQYRSGANTSLSDLGTNYAPQQIIVKMKSPAAYSEFDAWARSQGLVLEAAWPDMYMSNWSWQTDTSVSQMQETLGQSNFRDQMDFSEPNYLLSLPNDVSGSQFTSQSTVDASSSSALLQSLQVIDSVSARAALDANKPPVVVAIVDSGVDLQHTVFLNSGALWTNTAEIPDDGIDNDRNGFIDDVHGYDFHNGDGNPDDDNGHGTHCAGIVLSAGQDILKVPIDPAKVRIMALKFLGPSGSGSTSSAINAIAYAVKNGAKVISNSWGGSGYSLALEAVIADAYNQGVSFVAAAGNDGRNNDVSATFPAGYGVPQVISVAATDNADQLASFSNYGTRSVFVSAPGVGIVSTYFNSTNLTGSNSQFATLSGTSMATPFVAGTVALMLHERPEMNSYELKKVLLDQSDMVPSLGNRVMWNRRLNVAQAVQGAKAATLTGNQPSYKLSGNLDNTTAPRGAGCGLVLRSDGKPPRQGPPPATVMLCLLPLIAVVLLRRLSAGSLLRS